METKKLRNGSIDVLKFCLAVAIILFHGKKIYNGDDAGLFFQGASAVECFFIISGYYMVKTAYERKIDSFEYIKKRWLSIFPYHLFAFVFAFIVRAYLLSYFSAFSLQNLKKIAILGVLSVPEFLIFPPLSGLAYGLSGVNGMEWYLSALLLGMAILYPLAKKYPRQYCIYVGPLIFLFLSGWLYQTQGTYRVTYNYSNYICLGLVRAIALLPLGGSIYWAAKKQAEKRTAEGKDTYTYKERTLMTLLSIVCWIIVFGFFNSNLPKKDIFAVVYFMAAGVYLEMIRGTWFSCWFNNRFASILGKISLPLYLNQGYIRKVMIKAKLDWSYSKCILVYVGVTFLMASLSVLIADVVKKRSASTH